MRNDDWRLREEDGRFGQRFAVSVISASSLCRSYYEFSLSFLCFYFSRFSHSFGALMHLLARLGSCCGVPRPSCGRIRNGINNMSSVVVRREIEGCLEPSSEVYLLRYKTDVERPDMLNCWYAELRFCGLFRCISSAWVFLCFFENIIGSFDKHWQDFGKCLVSFWYIW